MWLVFPAAKSLQSCLTLCGPTDGSPPGSLVPRILQARTLEWVAISFFNAWKRKVKVKSLSRVRLLATPWTSAYQDPLSVGFSRQEYWSGVPLPSPLCLSNFLGMDWLSCRVNVYLTMRKLIKSFLKKLCCFTFQPAIFSHPGQHLVLPFFKILAF